MKKRRFCTIVAAFLVLALSGTAMATGGLSVPVGQASGEGENTFTVLEYTFDGRELRMTWEAETTGDEPLLFATGVLDNDVGPVISWYEGTSWYVPVGGEDAACCTGYEAAGFDGVTPSRPFNATIVGYFVRPLVEVVDPGAPDCALEPGVEHTGNLLVRSGECVTPVSYLYWEPMEDGGISITTQEDFIDGDTLYTNPHKDLVELYADMGYFEIVDICEVTFPVELPIGEVVAMRATELPTVSTEYYDIEFIRAEFSPFEARAEWLVRSKTGLEVREDWVFDLRYEVRLNGEPLTVSTGRKSSTDEANWYHCDMCTHDGYTVPLGDEAVTLEIALAPPDVATDESKESEALPWYALTPVSAPEDAEFPTITLTLEPVTLES